MSGCWVPAFGPDLGAADEYTVQVLKADLIVMTHSCDLEAGKSRFVALCPIHKLSDFETINPMFSRKGRWEEVRKGRQEGLHMLASPDDPSNNRDARVVNFRQIHSLPVEYLENHAESIGARWRLLSPYLEHFSQAFARFFMRVGLPSSIPKF